jgi:YegS/Rv2252/BmrU family lipid kinase
MPNPILVILNPWSGRGRGAKCRADVLRGLKESGVPFEMAETTGPGHAVGLAREAARAGAERVLVAGGDGAIHEAVNGLMQSPLGDDGASRTALGVIPLGTGNDFAKLVGVYNLPPEVAALRMMRAAETRFDVGRCGSEYFDNMLGVGFDAETVRHANKIKRLRGVAVYLAAIYRTFLSFRAPLLEIDSREHRESGAMMMVAACIGMCGGGSFYLAPQSDPEDGLLDVCLIRKVGLMTFLRSVPKVMKGTHTSLDEVTLFRTRSVTIRSTDGRPLVLHLDGELRELGLAEVTVTIEPRRLRVLVAR